MDPGGELRCELFLQTPLKPLFLRIYFFFFFVLDTTMKRRSSPPKKYRQQNIHSAALSSVFAASQEVVTQINPIAAEYSTSFFLLKKYSITTYQDMMLARL